MRGEARPARLPTVLTGVARRHRFAEHGGEVELELEAPTEAEVLEEAAVALAELIGRPGGSRERREISVTAADLPLLLVEWLSELVFLAEVDGFVPERSTVELNALHLLATAEGRRGAPAHLVKAVTLYRLAFERVDDLWRARVVLDV